MMSERKLTDAYWMEVGALRERERLLKVVEDDTHPIWFGPLQSAFIALIKNEPLKELQQLAEETGEHEHFDNPLIDKEKEKQKVQDYIDLLGIIGK
jgi:hypothetical protein